MTVNEKTKAIDNKIKQNKAQYDLGRKIAKVSALSLGNVGKHYFQPVKMTYRKYLWKKLLQSKDLNIIH